MHGRADVLASLADFRGGALALTGPPGIGRSAVLGALTTRLRGADVRLVDDGDALGRSDVDRMLRGSATVIVARRTPLPGWPELALPPLDDEAADRVLADADALPAGVRRGLVELAGGVPGHLLALARSGVVSAVLPPGGRYREVIARAFAADPSVLVAACGGRVAASAGAVAAGLVRPDGTAPSPAVAATIRAEAGPAACRATWAALAARESDPAKALRYRAAADPDAVEPGSLAAAARTADPATASRLARMAALRTTDPDRRSRLLLAAAEAAWSAGRPARALADLAEARHAPAGRVALLRGEIELRDGDPTIAAHELAAASARLTHAKDRAVALMLAGEARRMAGDLTGHAALARALAALGSADPLAAGHSTGLAATFAGNHAAARGPLRHAAAQTAADPRRHIWAGEVALTTGQIGLAHEHAAAAVALARAEAPALLPVALAHLAVVALVADRVAAAVRAATEGRALAGRAMAGGQRNVAAEHAVLLALAAVSLGDRSTALARLDEAAPAIADRGLGRPAAYAAWARACADLIDDRPDDALSRLRTMATGVGRAHPGIRTLAVPQLVEAAVRCGEHELAARALSRYDAWATSLRGPHWRAVSHRCHALLATDPPAHFDRALALHRQAGATLELARTHLLYAHHLRRDRRPSAARAHLREALHLFHAHGAAFWVERVRTELRAAAPVPADGALTPQQAQIARLVADGETNREIAQRLVLSPRTVEHHLRNIYTRLGIRSRTELARLVVGTAK